MFLDHSYYYYNATGIREDMCGFEEFTHEPDPFEFRPTPPIVLRKTEPPLIGIGAGGREMTVGDRYLIGCKCPMIVSIVSVTVRNLLLLQELLQKFQIGFKCCRRCSLFII